MGGTATRGGCVPFRDVKPRPPPPIPWPTRTTTVEILPCPLYNVGRGVSAVGRRLSTRHGHVQKLAVLRRATPRAWLPSSAHVTQVVASDRRAPRPWRRWEQAPSGGGRSGRGGGRPLVADVSVSTARNRSRHGCHPARGDAAGEAAATAAVVATRSAAQGVPRWPAGARVQRRGRAPPLSARAAPWRLPLARLHGGPALGALQFVRPRRMPRAASSSVVACPGTAAVNPRPRPALVI